MRGARRSAPKTTLHMESHCPLKRRANNYPRGSVSIYGEPRRFEERMVAPRIMLIMRCCCDIIWYGGCRQPPADTANNLRCPASLFGCALNPNGAQSKPCDSLAHTAFVSRSPRKHRGRKIRYCTIAFALSPPIFFAARGHKIGKVCNARFASAHF